MSKQFPSREFPTVHPVIRALTSQSRIFRIDLIPKLFKKCRDYFLNGFQKLPARSFNLKILSILVADNVLGGR